MTADRSESRDAVEDADKKNRHSEALARKARFFSTTSRIFMVIAGLGFAAALFMLLQEPNSLRQDPKASPEQLRAEALIESGRAMGTMFVAGISVVGLLISMLLAMKWARAASESIANSESANRKVLQIIRSSVEPFVLYLRGFEKEARSLMGFLPMPISTKRPDKATRWIESEIVDELKQRNRKVFCIANPVDTFLLPGAIRLYSNSENWLSEITDLAHDAEIVVVYFSSASPGLLAEIDLLRQENLATKSVLVARNGLLRQLALPKGDFLTALAPLSIPILDLNQSAFGPIVGRRRFRRELKSSIGKVVKS